MADRRATAAPPYPPPNLSDITSSFLARLIEHGILYQKNGLVSIGLDEEGEPLENPQADLIELVRLQDIIRDAATAGDQTALTAWALLAVIAKLTAPALRARESQGRQGKSKGDPVKTLIRRSEMAADVIKEMTGGCARHEAMKRVAKHWKVSLSVVRDACGSRPQSREV